MYDRAGPRVKPPANDVATGAFSRRPVRTTMRFARLVRFETGGLAAGRGRLSVVHARRRQRREKPPRRDGAAATGERHTVRRSAGSSGRAAGRVSIGARCGAPMVAA
ncbi:TPA: hypothetical protein QDE50_01455 [Burkholderia cenocepacia]|nr:hypothetical protein [Burkholderia cenocepacia]HDR9884915.1 hypothetical protein [Burkholderia cenocepacia]